MITHPKTEQSKVFKITSIDPSNLTRAVHWIRFSPLGVSPFTPTPITLSLTVKPR